MVAAHLDPRAVQLRGDLGQTPRRRLRVHQHRIHGVAHRGPLHLGVEHDIGGHFGVRVPVNVGMAHAHAAGHHGHLGALRHEVDESRPAPGHQQVDVLFHAQDDIDQRPVGIVHELHGLGGQSGLADGPMDQGHQRRVRTQRFLAASEKTRVSRFQCQGNYVRRYIGPAFVDAGDHSQRSTPLFDLQPVRQHEGLDQFSHRIGQACHAANVRRHPVEPVRVQEQAVQERGVDAGGLGVLIVGCIGLQYRTLLGLQGSRDVFQGVVAYVGRRAAQSGRRSLGGLTLFV